MHSAGGYRSVVPNAPPPPSAQPVRSALKQPSSGGKPTSPGGRGSRARDDDPRFGPKLDPREELMIAIRNAGGRNALNKVILKRCQLCGLIHQAVWWACSAARFSEATCVYAVHPQDPQECNPSQTFNILLFASKI